MEFIDVELESDFDICRKSVAHYLSPTLAALPPKKKKSPAPYEQYL